MSMEIVSLNTNISSCNVMKNAQNITNRLFSTPVISYTRSIKVFNLMDIFMKHLIKKNGKYFFLEFKL